MNFEEYIEQEAKDIINEYRDDIEEAITELETIDAYEIIHYTDLQEKITEWVDTSWYSILRWDCFDELKTEMLTMCYIIEEYSHYSLSEIQCDGYLEDSITSITFETIEEYITEEVVAKLEDMINEHEQD